MTHEPPVLKTPASPGGIEADTKRQAMVALGVAIALTGVLAVCTRVVPARFVATAIAALFLGLVWYFVWDKDDDAVTAHGLSLGGLLLPRQSIDWSATFRSAGLVLVLAILVFIPFTYGYVVYYRFLGLLPQHGLAVHPPGWRFAENAFGQLLMVALPEEAFYRGYLQTRLERALPAGITVLGGRIGIATFVTSVVFAVGHIATIPHPARLAVFFPSLLFGWMRSRTGGIGAALVFHACCNLYSDFLGRSFGLLP
jgi:uncharacterized protein